MNRFFALVVALAWPLCAHAFQDQIMHLKGVTITATQSATRLCGVDFVIRVTDDDQHLVKIDYSYNGLFKSDSSDPDSSARGPRQTRSDKINVSVGRWTLDGNLARVAAPEFPLNTLVCRGWDFHFSASEYNASADQRSHEDKLKQQEQARIDEINQRKAEEAERKRKAEQNRQDYLNAQAKAKRDQLAAYKNASPENARCIINEPADINRCEQAKARERADLLKRQQDEMWAQKQRDAKALADARQQEQFRQSDLLYERTRADPCGVAAEVAQQRPSVQQQQPNAAAARQQAERLAQWEQANAGHQARCAAHRNQTQNFAAPPALTQPRQVRAQAQQKAQADLNAAIQDGRNTVGDAATSTQTMKNDNANLMDMINNIK